MSKKSPTTPTKITPYTAKDVTMRPFAHHFLPDLEVLVLTYNHGDFLRECLDSILAQKTTYTYRIHILDDKSTDNTSEIAAEYAKTYPDRIIHHLYPHNVGPTPNGTFGFAQAHGTYVTLIEGDDYWCEPTKVQTMLDFLEHSTQYAGCTHDTLRTTDNSSVPEAAEGVYTFDDFAKGKVHFHVSATIWRNIYRGPQPFLHNEWVGDIFSLLVFSQHGDVYYMDKPWSYYRIHETAMFQGEDPAKIKRQYTLTVQALRTYQKYFKTGSPYKMLRQREAKFKLGWIKERLHTHPLIAAQFLPSLLWQDFITSTNGYKALTQWFKQA